MDIAIILTHKFSGSKWILNGDDYEGLEWLSETPKKPTLPTLTELWPIVQNELKSQADAKAAARDSALAKLAALGLTPEEIASL